MKVSHLLAVFTLLAGIADAATVLTFDGGGTDAAYAAQQFGTAPPPSVVATGGNPGGYLRLTVNLNSQSNLVAVDQTDPGTFPVSTFGFDFRIDNLGAGGADGFSFSYIDTALHGATGALGAALFTAEDPGAPGVLGFGFDTWGNAAPNDFADPGEFGANYSEISVFSNGALISRVDDTRLLATPLNLKDGAWHRAAGVVDFLNHRVSLTVDGNPIFTNADVPDLVPFESRILFAGRTGGANERLSLDNVDVRYVPEPASAILVGIGGLILLRRRHR